MSENEAGEGAALSAERWEEITEIAALADVPEQLAISDCQDEIVRLRAALTASEREREQAQTALKALALMGLEPDSTQAQLAAQQAETARLRAALAWWADTIGGCFSPVYVALRESCPMSAETLWPKVQEARALLSGGAEEASDGTE